MRQEHEIMNKLNGQGFFQYNSYDLIVEQKHNEVYIFLIGINCKLKDNVALAAC